MLIVIWTRLADFIILSHAFHIVKLVIAEALSVITSNILYMSRSRQRIPIGYILITKLNIKMSDI